MNREILIISFIFIISFSLAQVPTFHQFSGFIFNVSGETPLQGDYTVYAFMNGSLAGYGGSTNGQYGVNPLFFVEGISGQEGETVSFYIDGYFSTNVSFNEEGYSDLNLIYNSSASLTCIDVDSDGYGLCPGCGTSTGCTFDGNDCNDQDVNTNPGEGEVCGDGLDNNCNGVADDGCTSSGSTSSGGSSGSSGGSITSTGTFNLSTDSITTKIVQGETKKISFTVIDAGIGGRSISITSNLPFVTPETATLPTRGSVNVELDVVVSLETDPDLYIGELIIVAGSVTKEITLSVEVVSEDSLFDMIMNLPPEYVNVHPGENISADFYLTKLTSRDVNEVVIKYMILDENDNVIREWSETRDITETETSYTRFFDLPTELKFGKHFLYSQLEYEGKTASASNLIHVGPRPIDNFRWLAIILIVAISIISVVIILLMHRKKEDQEALAQV